MGWTPLFLQHQPFFREKSPQTRSVWDAKKFKEFFERIDQKNPSKIRRIFGGTKIGDFRLPRFAAEERLNQLNFNYELGL